MLSHRFYYIIKPFVPWRVRMALRRITARRKRKRCHAVWPIDESTSRPPAGWPGWPEGRKFTFAITHDVEGPKGLAKCRQLAELEMKLGFRSCFNFIPEGPYQVPPDLRAWLTANGFEVGVHDLNHDGKLFTSRRGFVEKAKRINHYLSEWRAGGYRSGFMLRNLDWLHDLNITYDSSTFDTDPFEPQPDGAGTIFPYWITFPGGGPGETSHAPSSELPAPSSHTGYVELPYTLPQDSTLFLLLEEKSPEIWLRKLDWIARHGGMALVNVHPDYLCFENEAPSPSTFPVSHFSRLLEHVVARHGSDAWLANPRDIANHVRQMAHLPENRRPLRVCMVTHSHYASDARVIRYAEALASRGDHVDVVALRPRPSAAPEETLNGVNVFRVQDRFYKNQSRPLDFLLPILRFFSTAAIWIARRQRRYDLFHIHNIPDFLVFVTFFPRLRGARVILDIHDLVPEFYESKFSRSTWSFTGPGLRLIERLSARFADHIIIANHLWLERYESRTRSAGKCSVFINNVDETLFYPRPKRHTGERKIIIFPGGLHWHQGLDIAIRAFPRILAQVPTAEFHIYGDGSQKAELVELAGSLGLQERILFFETKPTSEIATIMGGADLAIVPKRADSFGNEAYSTKIMEFMSLGVPVVASETKIERFYFNDEVIRFFRSGDEADLAAKAVEVLTNPALQIRLTEAAAAFAAANCWGRYKREYLSLVDRLAARRQV